jgi:hypothetical protein
MTGRDEKVRDASGGYSLELPASLAKQKGSPVGSLFTVDQGPFSDRLTCYVARSPDPHGPYGGCSWARPGLIVVVRAAESVPLQVARDL